MASFIRTLLRTYSSAKKCKKGAKSTGHSDLFHWLSLGVVLPGITGLSYYILGHKEEEEEKEYVPYEYLNIRNKRFPWGDGNTPLFYNPRKNHIPQLGGGYEEEGENGGEENGSGENGGSENNDNDKDNS